MGNSSNMLRSDGGLELPPEICLHISEYLIHAEPRAVVSLLLTSKAFSELLKTFEKSICKTVTLDNYQFEYVNALQDIITYSQMSGYLTVKRFTFPWVHELHCRTTTLDALFDHALTEMEDLSNSWPRIDVPLPELKRRILMFKKRAFQLLYKVADCVAGLSPQNTSDLRKLQATFLDGLTTVELAALGVMVEVMGQGFFTITMNALNDANMPGACGFDSPLESLWSPLTPGRLLDAYRVREIMCVFEDLVQQYGPFFAWSFVGESRNRHNRPHIWARDLMQNGLNNMDAFELGHTMSYASLQSVVWRIFCKKMDCPLENSWMESKVLVEKELRSYAIKA